MERPIFVYVQNEKKPTVHACNKEPRTLPGNSIENLACARARARSSPARHLSLEWTKRDDGAWLHDPKMLECLLKSWFRFWNTLTIYSIYCSRPLLPSKFRKFHIMTSYLQTSRSFSSVLDRLPRSSRSACPNPRVKHSHLARCSTNTTNTIPAQGSAHICTLSNQKTCSQTSKSSNRCWVRNYF